VVENNTIGCMLTYTEFISQNSVHHADVDPLQVLGKSDWTGGLKGLLCTECQQRCAMSDFSVAELDKESAPCCSACARTETARAAREGLQEILDDPSSAQAHRDLAHMLMNERIPNRRLDGFDWFRGCSSNPEDVRKWSDTVATSMNGSARTEECLTLWAKAIAIEAQMPEVLLPGDEVVAVTSAARALLLDHSHLPIFAVPDPMTQQLSRRVANKRLVEAAERLAKDKQSSTSVRADALAFLSVIDTLDGDLIKALHHIDLALLLRPSHSQQLQWRASIHAMHGTFGKALEDLKAARDTADGPYSALERFEASGQIGMSLFRLQRTT
jgi:hypothetical protein